jgi:lysophospholipase L1-like esterase
VKIAIDGLQFHNCAALEQAVPYPGLHLCRFPGQVRSAISDRGRVASEESTGCEIRFVTPAVNIRVTLMLSGKDGEVAVYKGGLFHSVHRLEADIPKSLHLAEPAHLRTFPRERLLSSGFAPEVWRIVFSRSNAIVFDLHSFGHPVRAPRSDETPHLRWIAYGSSITHGLSSYPLSYIDQAARRLGADVWNKGMSGSCYCETEMSDFLAEQKDWDIMTLELGINMRDVFSTEVFASRTGYLLDRLTEAHPEKPIIVITTYPNYATHTAQAVGEQERDFNELLRERVAVMNSPNVYLLEGSAIMEDYSTLSCDLLHPNSFGHMKMGERLAELMKPIVEKYRLPLH